MRAWTRMDPFNLGQSTIEGGGGGGGGEERERAEFASFLFNRDGPEGEPKVACTRAPRPEGARRRSSRILGPTLWPIS